MSDLTTTFTNIANAIRSKTGSSDTMTPSEMPDEIAGIETPMDSINITQNGTYEPSAGRGYNQVIVEVPEPTLITKSITANGTYTASDDDADGYSSVTVAVEGFKKKSIANTPTDIASFADGTANPMPSLEISIEPQQDLHGYENPWPAGGGKNKFNKDDSNSIINGYFRQDVTTITASDNSKTILVKCKTNTTYTVSKTAGARFSVGYTTESPTIGTSVYGILTYFTQSAITITTGADAEYLVAFVYNSTADTITAEAMIASVQVEEGSTATSYSPYSNICPISGWDEANVTREGKNLLPNTFSSYSTNNNYAFMNGVVPNGETARFTLTDKDTSVDISGCYIGFQTGLSEQVNTISSTYRWAINNGVVQTNKSNISDTNVVCDGVMIYPKNQTTFDKLFSRYDIMVELGSTATSYSPYQGSTLSIPFHDSSDNPITIYGGRLNVTSGELRVTKASVDLGTVNWAKSSMNYFIATLSDALYSNTRINFLCSMYSSVKGTDVASAITRGDKFISITTYHSSNQNLLINDTTYTSVSALVSAIAGQTLVYELATPITYQLTPAQVTTLLNQNNIFADCGQILEGEYFVTL